MSDSHASAHSDLHQCWLCIFSMKIVLNDQMTEEIFSF